MKKNIGFGLMAVGLVGAAVASEVRFVDEFDLSGSTCGLGKTARRIRHSDAESVWTRPLVGGDVAVALVNRYPFAREIKVTFAELGLTGERWVRDLWRQKCEGRHSGEYFALVPPHATKLVKLRSVDCPRCDGN